VACTTPIKHLLIHEGTTLLQGPVQATGRGKQLTDHRNSGESLHCRRLHGREKHTFKSRRLLTSGNGGNNFSLVPSAIAVAIREARIRRSDLDELDCQGCSRQPVGGARLRANPETRAMMPRSAAHRIDCL
jgi:hypothetical protein